ncbi:MAG TPA: S46 family peptidase [Bacteroidales bacterium]|mgnify:CR=1 FL=1|nr:S46 family peptidase [Bacteroidales bacterium]
MKKTLALFILTLITAVNTLHADEGMWIPLLLEKYNIKDMQAKGFKLTAEDIYSINQACLMDAVVIFGRGCTGEVVSDQGLLFTNHHCGYGAIQRLSSIEHDYLTDGFWAMTKEEELPNPGLTVRFLKKIEDVTDKVLENVTGDMSEENRDSLIRANIKRISDASVEGSHYIPSIRPFFYGNQYFLFLHEEFKDVRLVGAPPSAIGKFGGDTDNWMWPRHTGDFSIFRIYADKDNKPAEYSPENVPYKPKKFLPVSIKGIKDGDFTWVMGYPGSTQEYLTSDAIKLIAEVRNPNNVKVRDIRLEVMNKYMDTNDTIRIKYASKNAGVSNSWKRWKGEIDGLKRMQTIQKKIELEKDFDIWAQENNKTEYFGIVDELAKIYNEMQEYAVANDYWREAILGVEIISFASRFDNLIKQAASDVDQKEFAEKSKQMLSSVNQYFKDYEQRIDQEIFTQIVPLYFANVDAKFHPVIENFKPQGQNNGFINKLYKESVFNNPKLLTELLEKGEKESIKALAGDPVFQFYSAFSQLLSEKVFPKYYALNGQTNKLYRLYVKGLQEMQPDKVFYPDANFTMRVSYGHVAGYSPRDAVEYKYYTTLDGVIEKDNPEIYDYDVPDKLKEVYKAKDFGQYEVDGTVPVCFVANNHTTGGNSGSPVLDAEGNLIGLNFDRGWDGIMSDMMYDPERSRNVTLDVRYLLFVVDKMAGAQNIINELMIVK